MVRTARRVALLVLACLLALGLVVAGPMAPAANAYVVAPAPILAAPISTLGAPAIIAGIAVGGFVCAAVDSCRNWVLDFVDGPPSGQTDSFVGAPGEAMPGNTLSWNETPGTAAQIKPDGQQAFDPVWKLNWNPVPFGSPGGEYRVDVVCGPTLASAATIKAFDPVVNIYPGNPASTFGVRDVCNSLDYVFEVRAYITGANYCDPCGGDIVWRSADVVAPGALRSSAITVTCRAPNGQETTITAESTYALGSEASLDVPSCSGADGAGVQYPGVGTVFGAEDTFNRGDRAAPMGPTSNQGLVWSTHTSNCGIASNEASCPTGGTNRFTEVNIGTSDGRVGLTCVSGCTADWGFRFRTSNDTAAGYMWHSSGGLYDVGAAPSFTLLQSVSPALANGDVLEVEMTGGMLTFFRNGVEVGTRSGMGRLAQTSLGLYHGGTSVVTKFDTLKAPVPDLGQKVTGLTVEVKFRCGLTLGTLEECAKQAVNVPGVVTSYPDCLDGSCTLRVLYQGVPCTIGAPGCVNWTTKVDAAPGDYTCRWGPYSVPMNDCDGLATRYDTEPGPSPTPSPSPSPSLAPQPQPTTSAAPDPTATAAPRPGEAGAPAAGDAEGQECWPSGWGVFNPLEWVYRPTVCALKWAFVPPPGTWNAKVQPAVDTWGASPPGQWSGVLGDVVGAVGGLDDSVAVGCDGGPGISGELGGAQWSLDPLAACTEPMASVASMTKTVLTLIVAVGGAFLVINPILLAFGVRVRDNGGND